MDVEAKMKFHTSISELFTVANHLITNIGGKKNGCLRLCVQMKGRCFLMVKKPPGRLKRVNDCIYYYNHLCRRE
jgi:hypothetical protein